MTLEILNTMARKSTLNTKCIFPINAKVSYPGLFQITSTIKNLLLNFM